MASRPMYDALTVSGMVEFLESISQSTALTRSEWWPRRRWLLTDTCQPILEAVVSIQFCHALQIGDNVCSCLDNHVMLSRLVTMSVAALTTMSWPPLTD